MSEKFGANVLKLLTGPNYHLTIDRKNNYAIELWSYHIQGVWRGGEMGSLASEARDFRDL